jgi:putative Holliday junction resolvase
VAALKDVIVVPIRTWDERLTTVSASKALRSGGTKAANQRGKIDAAAAAVLLQGYLDSLSP